MLTPEFIADAERLCRAAAPEITAPVYLMMHPDTLPRPKDCRAYASIDAVVDIPLRDALVQQGRWRGPGLCIVFMEFSRVFDDMLGILLHELAHGLPARKFFDAIDTPVIRALHYARAVEWANDTSPDTDTHGIDFVRACLHLHFRAVWHGHRTIPPNRLCFAGANYEMSSDYHYRQAIGDEPSRMLDATFSEILAAEPPAAFSDLWRADLERRKLLEAAA